MVLVMAWATFRIGEAIGPRRNDLDLHRGRLCVANNVVEVSGRRPPFPEADTNAAAKLDAIRLRGEAAADRRLLLGRSDQSDRLVPVPARTEGDDLAVADGQHVEIPISS
jgi:hypothetical protein